MRRTQIEGALSRGGRGGAWTGTGGPVLPPAAAPTYLAVGAFRRRCRWGRGPCEPTSPNLGRVWPRVEREGTRVARGRLGALRRAGWHAPPPPADGSERGAQGGPCVRQPLRPTAGEDCAARRDGQASRCASWGFKTLPGCQRRARLSRSALRPRPCPVPPCALRPTHPPVPSPPPHSPCASSPRPPTVTPPAPPSVLAILVSQSPLCRPPSRCQETAGPAHRATC